MTEEMLRRFLERLNADPPFRNRALQDTVGALVEFGLRPAEATALACTEADSLRRLAFAEVPGNDVGGPPQIMAKSGFFCWVSRHLCTWIFCGPPGTRDWQCKKQP